ncbi:MAG: type III secretion system effector protein [Deltaproteobacteria bacterium]|nr:type III secretion system effector protein [Deltaproteobacteria bacterium]
MGDLAFDPDAMFQDAARADRARAQAIAGVPTGPGREAEAALPDSMFARMRLETDTIRAGMQQEGMTALMDPTGMLDRQQAQRELRGNFEIVAPGARTDAPNQVTEADFEHIARLYSDIRLDRTNLHLDPGGMSERAQLRFRRDMMGQLGRILQTGTGRDLLEGLAHNPHENAVNLRPYRDERGRVSDTNGGSDPQYQANASDPRRGTGADIGWTPWADAVEITSDKDAWHQQRGDVGLFHELTHAWHEVNGTLDVRPTVGEPGLDGTMRDRDAGIGGWEHQAVGLGRHAADPGPNENRYRLERRRIGAHGGATVVPGDRGMELRQDYAERPPEPAPG